MNETKTYSEKIKELNFPFTDNIVCLLKGGSDLHGAKDGTSDLDLFGVYIEPPENILGLNRYEHFCVNTNQELKQNTSDSFDVKLYSLHKWGNLVMKGDSTIISYLFAEPIYTHSLWDNYIASLKPHILSLKTARHYLGFATAQRERMEGKRGTGRHGQRLDLIEKYGYDTKFAMHYIRLLCECRELLEKQTLTFPRPERLDLIDIRRGKWELKDIFKEGSNLTYECEELMKTAPLPDSADGEAVSNAITKTYLDYWRIKCA